ncbi:MAG TPA: ABC transporter permease [Planctomycetaceae bacterium]|nr:ABC transporter permease [Planctomycetaceae bacterium]HIQ19850.1 ABC transporter permease [Planctomycetota bacterium]
MRFATVVWKNILRRRTRSALTVSGVAVAVAAVVALVGIARDFESSALEIYQRQGTNLVVLRAGTVQWANSVLDERLGQEIARIEGVRRVSGLLFEMISFDDYDLFGVMVRGLPPDSFVLEGLELVGPKSRLIRPDDGRVVLLGQRLAEGLGKTVGDEVKVVEEPFEVIGIFESPNLFESGSMIMPLDQLQRLQDRKGQVTLFSVVAERGDRETVEAICRRITTEIPRLVEYAPSLEARPVQEFVEQAVELRLARSVAWLTSAIALVVGTIGMINTMLMAVFERTRELALLRAIGWRKSRVVRMILLESVLLGVAGAVLGTVGGIVLTRILSMLPASGRMVAGDISASVVLQGFAVAMVVGVCGGVYPALRAARLAPTEGLRHE